jgi:hypothetical protein
MSGSIQEQQIAQHQARKSTKAQPKLRFKEPEEFSAVEHVPDEGEMQHRLNQLKRALAGVSDSSPQKSETDESHQQQPSHQQSRLSPPMSGQSTPPIVERIDPMASSTLISPIQKEAPMSVIAEETTATSKQEETTTTTAVTTTRASSQEEPVAENKAEDKPMEKESNAHEEPTKAIEEEPQMTTDSTQPEIDQMIENQPENEEEDVEDIVASKVEVVSIQEADQQQQQPTEATNKSGVGKRKKGKK